MKNMSHELDENIRRRELIVSMIPKKGMEPRKFAELVMSCGYSQRGAYEKIKELKFLHMVEEKAGLVYAVARTSDNKTS